MILTKKSLIVITSISAVALVGASVGSAIWVSVGADDLNFVHKKNALKNNVSANPEKFAPTMCVNPFNLAFKNSKDTTTTNDYSLNFFLNNILEIHNLGQTEFELYTINEQGNLVENPELKKLNELVNLSNDPVFSFNSVKNSNDLYSYDIKVKKMNLNMQKRILELELYFKNSNKAFDFWTNNDNLPIKVESIPFATNQNSDQKVLNKFSKEEFKIIIPSDSLLNNFSLSNITEIKVINQKGNSLKGEKISNSQYSFNFLYTDILADLKSSVADSTKIDIDLSLKENPSISPISLSVKPVKLDTSVENDFTISEALEIKPVLRDEYVNDMKTVDEIIANFNTNAANNSKFWFVFEGKQNDLNYEITKMEKVESDPSQIKLEILVKYIDTDLVGEKTYSSTVIGIILPEQKDLTLYLNKTGDNLSTLFFKVKVQTWCENESLDFWAKSDKNSPSIYFDISENVSSPDKVFFTKYNVEITNWLATKQPIKDPNSSNIRQESILAIDVLISAKDNSNIKQKYTYRLKTTFSSLTKQTKNIAKIVEFYKSDAAPTISKKANATKNQLNSPEGYELSKTFAEVGIGADKFIINFSIESISTSNNSARIKCAIKDLNGQNKHNMIFSIQIT